MCVESFRYVMVLVMYIGVFIYIYILGGNFVIHVDNWKSSTHTHTSKQRNPL